MPLISVHSTVVPEHEVVEIRIAGDLYSFQFGPTSGPNQYIDVERVAAVTAALQTAVASAVIVVRPE